MATSITIQPQVTEVSAVGTNTAINITTSTTTVELATAFPSLVANDILVSPYATITSTNLQTALEQLADQNFRGSSIPPSATLEVGDTWYDTANNIFYVYRTVNGITDWYPLLNTDADKPDRLDGGAF